MNNPSAANSVRHQWPDRLFHWCMAVTTLILLFSAFLPILGVEFDWIPWHWVSGVILTVVVLFHIVRALFIQGIGKMLPRGYDFRRGGFASNAEAKYDIFQKGYHWAVALVMLVIIVTGILMLLKLDTVFWDRNPAILSDQLWGYVYVAHGAAALALIFLIIMHVYFNFLPEHRQLLVSMITGKGPMHPIHVHPEHPREQQQAKPPKQQQEHQS